MKKIYSFFIAGSALLCLFVFLMLSKSNQNTVDAEGDEHEEYENLQDRYAQEFEQLLDPALNAVPTDRLVQANLYTRQQQERALAARTTSYNWQQRGPIYDFVGPSNGNSRAGNGYTAGIVQTILVDLASDPTGNRVLAGSPSGGLWRCTNLLAQGTPAWQPVNDFMANLAVSSICQNPASPNIMYLATGDGNTRDVRGFGIWKSTDFGNSWAQLPSTIGFNTAFKIICDAAGNVYLAGAGALNGVSGGLKRSLDGGATWTNISPTGLTSSNPWYVTDVELSSTGRLHAVFGYFGSRVQHFYTQTPATVTSTSGWNTSTGIRENTSVACSRIEMATLGNTLYALTANSSNNIDSCYKSTDGGATWTLQNSVAYPTQLGSGQTWYAVTLQINPDNPSEFIAGGLDAYRSVNDGQTVTRMSYWVGATAPYVHADHHFMSWYKAGTESRVVIGCDGGVFYSSDGGVTFRDRNENLGLKQFYSCAIHPTAGTNYLFAGSQDNGCHQLKNPGLSFSTETTGGDGAYVHINQQNPEIQFGSYIYNQYRRSVNGGNNWSSVNLSNNTGYFINPFDYDDASNTLYSSNGTGVTTGVKQFRRWNSANTTNTSTSLVVDEMVRNSSAGAVSSLKVSPYTPDRLYMGSNNGKLLRLENASTVASSADITTNITDISSTSFPVGYMNCINTGTSDQTLVAVFTNYGVNNVWYSTNGGGAWTAIDGNLPDMPVWWAVFEPGSNSKLILGTEAGIYFTSAINGTGTVWNADPSFPIVRTRMLKVRSSDGTIVAATYGRGLYTAVINSTCATPAITQQPGSQTVCTGAETITLSVSATGTGVSYQWRKGGVAIAGATGNSYTLSNVTAASAGNYDVLISGSCGSITSAAATLTVNAATQITTAPAAQSGCAGTAASFTVAATGTGTLQYQWRKNSSAIPGATGATFSISSTAVADAGSYDVLVTGTCGTLTSAPVMLTVNTGGGCVTALPNIDPNTNSSVLMPNAVASNSTLRVNVQRATTINWTVTDAKGREVMRFVQKVSVGTNDKLIPLAHLARGAYFMAGYTDKGRLATLRFQKL